MIKKIKNHLSLCGFTAIILFFVQNADAADQFFEKKQFSCSQSASFYRCNDAKEHEISNKIYTLTGQSFEPAIEALGEGTVIEADAIIINGIANANNHSGKRFWTTGVKTSMEGGVTLFNSILNNVSIGVDVDEGGAFEMQNGVINATRMGGSVVGKDSFIFLNHAEIRTSAGAVSLFSQDSAKIEMKAGKIDFTNGIGVQTAGGGKVILDGVSITERGRYMRNIGRHSENSAFQMLQGAGSITVQRGRVNVTNAHGLSLQGNDNNTAHIENSTIMIRNKSFNGIRFLWEVAFDEDKETVLSGRGAVYLSRTFFMTPESTAIYSRQFESFLKLSQGSTVLGDLLLKAEGNSTVKVIADASTLIGGTHVDENSTATLELKNNSKWTLSQPKYEKLQNSAFSGSQLGHYSSLSSLNLVDSSLFFKELKTGDIYKTLLVGKGGGKAYHVQGNVHLYLNTYLDKGGDLQKQKTDRLLIHGDVEGTTIVHVQDAFGSRGDYTGERGNNKGISIIQVYGTANKDSFQLNGDYVTPEGSPYKYRLYAYGPSSSLGQADLSQRVLKGEGEFWDFRLESEVIQSPSSDYSDLFFISYFPVSRYNTSSSFSGQLPSFVRDEAACVEMGKSSECLSSSSLVTSVGTTVDEARILTRRSASRPISAESGATFPTFVRSVDTDALMKNPSALAFFPITLEEKAGVSERGRVSVISKAVFASELSPRFQKKVRAVVPQVATYLLLPNSLFHAGLMDMSHLNKQLEILRTVSLPSLKVDKNSALFLQSYGSNYRYVSDLSTLEYGFGGEIAYNAIEAGTLLKNIETTDSTISFGVMGTYGKVSLHPRDIKQSQESTFDKWTVTTYGSMQHDIGFYMNGLLSYGLFNGNVFTLARGKTTTLKGKSLSGFLTAGKAFMMEGKSFIFDPQVQVIYQNLQFYKAHDIDNFNIEMGKLDQWVVRVGGRLTKTFALAEKAHFVSFYGKLYFVRDFSDKQFVHFGDAFQLGAFGSSLEAGLGFNAQLSPKFTVHGDVNYQHKLTKAGFSGTHFSGGFKYHF
ncbi:autotransporter outer membrane beta-barrel domain-containing protein [Bartonella sp. 220]|uniref:autotransporter outer membrane beta-barrel domain-containing protein n=1 Tax=Bartonella sp. 220B TaxID=2967260 RepID=UPI0022A9816D|nr:autotransporter outer membrane beta-barrel domain-containing protein [Bartonella sp. 220B]MCZ2159077.1 autotransporter outer membrane beta-barrel domain-containing protein [Bartonella sp. 220B]